MHNSGFFLHNRPIGGCPFIMTRQRYTACHPSPAVVGRCVVALLTLMAFVFAATTPNLAIAGIGFDGRLCSLQPHSATSLPDPLDAGIPSIFDQCCITCVVAQSLAGGLSHQHFTLPIIGDATDTAAFHAPQERPLDRFVGFSRRARAPPSFYG